MERKVDPRKLKRYEIKMLGGHAKFERYSAYVEGCSAGYYKRPKRNPYPPGVRHNEWERGYKIAE